MKIGAIIIKSLKEQLRSIWILLLLLAMGPFFVLVYSLITESEESRYSIIVINLDQGVEQASGERINYGDDLLNQYRMAGHMVGSLPFVVEEEPDRAVAEKRLKDQHADALIIIDSLFSQALESRKNGIDSATARMEFVGDLTSVSYLLSAVWANELIHEYVLGVTASSRPVVVSETALGSSGMVDEFNLVVPGILIISIIMLMFTASIAFVGEVEHGTILRLQLSRMSSFDFLTGIGMVQLLIGIIAALLTLLTAIALGFQHAGSYLKLILIAGLTSLSIVSFSLIIAALTKSAKEILVVGNFPMFLFMFFTGAAFPINSKAWFSIAGYPVNLQGLMSPTHATSALRKILILKMDLGSVFPEIIAMLLLTLLYFLIGAWMFRKRHLQLS